MALIVAELSIGLIETLRPPMSRIKARDKAEDQIRRAASSVELNIGEGEYSNPGNRWARYFTAAGSAGETFAALRVAVAWGIVSTSDAERAVALLRRHRDVVEADAAVRCRPEWGAGCRALFDVMVPPIPEDQLRACLAVLYRACIEARMLGYEGQEAGMSARRAEFLADMMDAVHNIPQLLLRWRDVDESLLRGTLSGFDETWSSEGALRAVYEDALLRSDA